MKRSGIYLAVLSLTILTACGGGGGGGAPSYIAPSPAPTAPATSPNTSNNNTNNNSHLVATPSLVSTLNPLISNSTYGAFLNMSTVDLANSGSQTVVVAGDFNGPSANHLNSKISIFGWTNGQFVDQTSQWFTGTDNVIVGTPKTTFGNFAGNGYSSMFVAPGTDGQITTSTEVQMFVNNGSSFTRYDIAIPHAIDSNDSVAFSYNGIDNVLALGYPYSEVIMGSTTRNFQVYSVSGVSGASVASGNFLGTGQPSFIVGQYGASNCLGCTPDALVGFNFDGTTVTMPFIRNMPTPLFNTSAYFNQTQGSNTIKVVKMDFDESGVDSAFILAMPNNWQNSPYQSSIQFLKNNGSGVFTDVTSTTVTGYDMTKPASTSPIIIDLLGTGLPDIVLPYVGGAQVLTQVSKGQYVGSLASVITDFSSQMQTLLTAANNGQTSANATTTFVRGPNNNLYLLGMVPETLNGFSANQFFLSQITGTTIATTAQQAITAARTAWPWLTDSQLNTMITATGMSYAGVPIINTDSLFNPVGNLSVLNRPISGVISGVDLSGSNTLVTATDQLGRTFQVNLSPMITQGYMNSFNSDTEHIDQYELSSHTEYLINGAVNNYGALRGGYENRNLYNTLGNDPNLGPALGTVTNFTVGLPRAWQSGSWSAGVQYTTLNYNPWVGFAGSWGIVNSTNNFDHTVRYSRDGFTAVLGGILTTTNMTPGLITSVSDIYGVWGETGVRSGDFGLYAGVKPMVVSGSVSAVMPGSVDNAGNIQYTSKNLAIQNSMVSYVRALYNVDLNRRTHYRISGTAMSDGQFRILNELWINFE